MLTQFFKVDAGLLPIAEITLNQHVGDKDEYRLDIQARSRAVSSIDHQQQKGVAWDIINEALNEYDGFMLDDDYDAQACLNRIMLKMRDRRDATNPLSTKST